jgi:hypothetical protein
MEKDMTIVPERDDKSGGDLVGRLKSLREFMEPRWRQVQIRRGAIGVPSASEGLCRHSSFFVRDALELGGEKGWRVQGGYLKHRHYEQNPEGFERLDASTLVDRAMGVAFNRVSDVIGSNYWISNALYCEHWWLQRENTIIDLTGDQFGWEPIYHGIIPDRYLVHDAFGHGHIMLGERNTVSKWMRDYYCARYDVLRPLGRSAAEAPACTHEPHGSTKTT